jgi:hypothetical protein
MMMTVSLIEVDPAVAPGGIESLSLSLGQSRQSYQSRICGLLMMMMMMMLLLLLLMMMMMTTMMMMMITHPLPRCSRDPR